MVWEKTFILRDICLTRTEESHEISQPLVRIITRYLQNVCVCVYPYLHFASLICVET